MAIELGPVLVWFVLVAALGGVALPLAGLLFPRFADRGAGLAIPLAFVVLGVVGYWAGRLAFGVETAIAAVIVLAALSAVAIRRGVEIDPRRYLETLAVFAAAFAFLVGVRAVDPGVVAIGGEKFLDYGLLNSLYRTGTLPPEDPWFAGERVRYYYGGFLVTALLGHLSQTPPEYAYNLMLAATYAALVSSVYGLAGSVAADRGASRVRAGLFAAFLVGIASNLATPVRFLAWIVPGGHGIAGLFDVPLTRGGETVAHGIDAFGYWDASRVIEGTINEFPLFSFLNGDLHPHMLSLPILVLTVGVCYSLWRTPAPESTRRRLLSVGVVPVLVGWHAVSNTWDVPAVLGLTWLTLSLAPATPWSILPGALGDRVATAVERADRPALAETARPLVAAALVTAFLAVAVTLFVPFATSITGAGGRRVEFVAERSDPTQLLLVHGAFLFVAAWYGRRRLALDRDAVREETLAMGALLVALSWLLDALAFVLLVPVILVGWYLLRTGRAGYETLLFVAGAGLVTAGELVYLADGSGAGRLNTVFKTYVHVWVFWSIAAGVALAALLESRPTRAGIGSERSTATVAAGGTAERADGGPTDAESIDGASTGGGTTDGGSTGGRSGGREPTCGSGTAQSASSSPESALEGRRWAVLVSIVLVVSLALYGGLALSDRVDGANGDLTLDARHDVRTSAPDEAAAFEWLADREGQPRIVEAPTPPEHTYGGTDAAGNWPPSTYVSGASTFSGLPTIVGWTHSALYHGDDAYDRRVADAETVYTGSSAERAAVLEAYGIEYVYVGPNERAWYDPPDLAADDGIEVAATFGDVTIYRVDRSALEGTEDATSVRS